MVTPYPSNHPSSPVSKHQISNANTPEVWSHGLVIKFNYHNGGAASPPLRHPSLVNNPEHLLSTLPIEASTQEVYRAARQ